MRIKILITGLKIFLAEKRIKGCKVLSRRKAREFAFKVLYQVDQVNAEPQAAFQYLLKNQSLAEKDRQFSWDLIQGCLKNIDDIDKKLSLYARDCNIKRIPPVERSIMRVAGYEILYMDNSQSAIAIDEAIEISKRYGDQGLTSLVNAILDKIMGETK